VKRNLLPRRGLSRSPHGEIFFPSRAFSAPHDLALLGPSVLQCSAIGLSRANVLASLTRVQTEARVLGYSIPSFELFLETRNPLKPILNHLTRIPWIRGKHHFFSWTGQLTFAFHSVWPPDSVPGRRRRRRCVCAGPVTCRPYVELPKSRDRPGPIFS